MSSPTKSENDEDDALIDPYDEYDSIDYADLVGPSNSAFFTTPSPEKEDPENAEFDCLEVIDVERLLNEAVEKICSNIHVTPALAKILLHTHKWNVESIIDGYRRDYVQFLVDAKLKPQRYLSGGNGSGASNNASTGANPSLHSTQSQQQQLQDDRPGCSKNCDKSASTAIKLCPICSTTADDRTFLNLACGHQFCLLCWRAYIRVQMDIGYSSSIECMASKCRLLIPEDFVLKVLQSVPALRGKYEQLVFQDLVKDNPELRFCPGPNCNIVIRCRSSRAVKVTCKVCRTSCCFLCGNEYHAPTDCDMVKKWLVKCADDSETANYMTVNTKDCPNCHVCIEKSGGCNHMACSKCKHHFCWMCLGDWKQHGSEYYECSRYKENPNIVNESVHNMARKALEKYLFYFERWENHNKSLKLEQSLMERIKERIDDKVNSHEGTWIDWQYLYDAANLLTKCRYTLQYTYPYAYYLPVGPRKELFEYQQAQLESEIENLSWKVERAENTDRGDMERQMHVAELKRQTLLKDFSA